MLQKDDKLVKILKLVLDSAKSSHPTKEFKKWWDYYIGDFNDYDYINDSSNIIKPILETITSLVLDNMMTTAVIPSVNNFSEIQNINSMNDIADMLNDLWDYVKKQNNFNSLTTQVTRHGDIYGMGIAEVVWDPEMSKGEGNVRINYINPRNFYWDTSACNVENMNYCFIEEKQSIYSLKDKYCRNEDGSYDLNKIKEIDGLSKQRSQSTKSAKDSNPVGVITSQNDSYTQQAYTYGSSDGIEKANETVITYKCYIKDDSIFAPEISESEDTKESKSEFRMKYPNGRQIIFVPRDNNSIILEDKPIDYPFGFPICIYNPLKGDGLQGQGTVKGLINIQNRINKSYDRIKDLQNKFLSLLVYDEYKTGLTPESFTRGFTLGVKNYQPGTIDIITNNTLSEIKSLNESIMQLKADAYEQARVNPSMVSGEKQEGVNSGQMVRDLQESPHTSIKMKQRNLQEFLINITQKAIVLISKYYNTSRIIRINAGKEFLIIPTRPTPEEINNGVIPEMEVRDRMGKTIRTIKGDLSIGDYEVDVTAGAELPRSRTQFAEITVKLAEMGMFGDINDLSVKEQILSSVDYPNYREIIDNAKNKQDEGLNAPPKLPMDPEFMKAFADIFKSLEGFTQARQQLLKENGLPVVRDDIVDAPIQEVTSKGDALEVQMIRDNAGEIVEEDVEQDIQETPLEQPQPILSDEAIPPGEEMAYGGI